MSFKDTRAEIVHRRTYSRPKNDDGTEFETLAETTDRIIKHQEWLWERALGRNLNSEELSELDDLWDVFYKLEASPSGRTRWLGGTDVARTREASQFNCSFNTVRTPPMWLTLSGFYSKAVELASSPKQESSEASTSQYLSRSSGPTD